ncbi:MAG TPA: hypothetical protein VGK19_17665 [Capsulimonadaceae bacterium]|jgi:hypothetical protein
MKTYPFAVAAIAAASYASPSVAHATTLSAETSRPQLSCYAAGDAVTVNFTVADLAPGHSPLKLLIHVDDAHSVTLATKEIDVAAAGATWTTTYTAPASKLGFYRVYAKLSDGTTIPATGSRDAGFVTYIVVADPATRTVYPPSEARFGMQGGFNGALTPAPYLGYNWMNGPGGWHRNEPDRPGQFAEKRAAEKAAGKVSPDLNWTNRAAKAWAKPTPDGMRHGWPLYPVYALNEPPKWAAITARKVGWTAPIKPENLPDWDRYLRSFAQSVVEDAPDQDQHVYQVTWEPNWFNGTPAEFNAIYSTAYKALHAADPRAVVVGPTQSGLGGSMKQVAEWFADGFGSYIDGYCFHPYILMPSEPNSYVDRLRELKRFIGKRGGRDIPLYATEQGFAVPTAPASELEQAQALVRSSLVTLGEGARFWFGFYIADMGGQGGYGYFYNLKNKDVVFGTDRTGPKPVAAAYAAETLLIDGHETVGAVDYLGDTALGYAFQRGDDVVLALWDYSTKPRKVTLTVGTKSVDLYDWMGNRKSVATASGRLDVTLTQDPIYIRGVSPTLWGKSVTRPLELSALSLSTMPGGKAVIDGFVHFPGGADATRAQVSVGAPGLIPSAIIPATSREASKPFRFDFTVPVTTRPGRYVATVALSGKPGEIASRHVVVDVLAPATLAAVVPTATAADGKIALKSVAVTLAATQGEKVTGTASLSIAKTQGTETPFELAGNADTLIDLPGSITLEPGKSVDGELKVTSREGYSFTSKVPLCFVAAARTPKPPKVDGDLSDWTAPAVSFGAANVRTAWDSSALYVAFEVNTAWLPKAATTADKRDLSLNDWMTVKKDPATYDNVEVAFNLDPGKIERSTGDVYQDSLTKRRFTVLRFTPEEKGPLTTRCYTYNFDKLQAVNLYDWQVAFKTSTTGATTTYEASIPWKQLASDGPPKPGDLIGFSVAVNGGAVKLFDGIFPAEDSSRLGYLVFAP